MLIERLWRIKNQFTINIWQPSLNEGSINWYRCQFNTNKTRRLEFYFNNNANVVMEISGFDSERKEFISPTNEQIAENMQWFITEIV